MIGLGGAASAGDVPQIRYLDRPSGVMVQTEAATQDTAFAIASVGKTMTAVASLRRVDRGRLGLEDKAAAWIAPDIVQGFGGLNGITLRHLLTMTSGIPDYYTEDYLEDALDDPDRIQRADIALSYAFGEPQLFEPGTDFDYSNTNYVLLGLILEAETGKSYAGAMQQEVFAPAGMTNSFVFGSRPLPIGFADVPDEVRRYYQGAGFGDGGVIATAADVAQFYRTLFIDQTLLPSDLLVALTTDPLGVGYGMGIELDAATIGHSGGDLGFTSDVRLHRPTGMIAIELVADEDAETGWTEDQMPN